VTSEQSEHRSGERRRALKSGKIIFNDGQSVMNCVVKNLSESGARLESDSFAGCPRQFTLRLADGPSYACEVKWMRVNAAGVRFDRVMDDVGSS
jgi:hypothetical protein